MKQTNTTKEQCSSTNPELELVTQQRDDLLAALKDLRNRVVAEKPDCLNTTKADAAIAKAEGRAQ